MKKSDIDKVTFIITKERYNQVIKYSDNVTYFINTSIDFYINHIRTKYLQDVMYLFGLPFFIFLISIGFTLYFVNIFFFVLSGLSGVYLMIFFYLFYNKYRGVKFGVNRK